jgi:hypothetical protein
MRIPTFQRRTERRGLRLWPVGTVLTLTFAAAVIVAAVVFYTGWEVLGTRGLKTERRLDAKTLFDLVKLSFGVVAGAGALVALVVAYRRQRVDEDGALREATRLHTERFTTAVSQLGNESAAVRLGGVHALVGLADDAPTRGLRQTCIDVLCAYLRLPYAAEADLPTGDAEARHAYLSLREVRHTVIRLIRDHLRLEATHPHSWQGHDFDFTETTFDGGDFGGAVFCGGTVSFEGSEFVGGAVSFFGTEFSSGKVSFLNARFTGGTVYFLSSQFSGAAVDFSRGLFASGAVSFNGADFSGGAVRFDSAEFAGAGLDFTGAWIATTASFKGALFTGSEVIFDDVRFVDGVVKFDNAQFTSGYVRFNGAEFVNDAGSINGREYAGAAVSFDSTQFAGATVDFSHAVGTAPSGLLPATGTLLPTGLNLPSAWYPAGP